MKLSRTLIPSVALSFVLALSACKSSPIKSEPARSSDAGSVQPRDPSLSQALATERAARVANVRYAIRLRLDREPGQFSGQVDIRFDHRGAPTQPLRLDFQNGTVSSVTRVGATEPVAYTISNEGLLFPAASLREGENALTVSFRHDYSSDGEGLMRVVDPEDKNVYLYTNLEAYGASRVFPCFDQPDLKAKFRTEVDAPTDWQVISTTRETSSKSLDATSSASASSASRKWIFPDSLAISTYLWSMHAGPFEKWEDRAGSIPLRLFARKTFGKYVVAKDWFRYTKAGLKFYDELFRVKYPFAKYDQIILPEFAIGAMENVAAVAFNERYVTRGKPTIRDQRALAGTLLHEMAHMWFGDLVTMKWWNGLWLNESFATYISSIAMPSLPEFRDYAREFHGEKEWAYYADTRVTTHPIEVPVVDTSIAESIFDGISYGKGASVLKQLHFLLGDEAFRAGLRDYFKRYAFGNATLADFMGSMARASKRDLSRWTKEWLETPNMNALRPEFTCKAGRIDSFRILQTGAPIRQHRFRVATYFAPKAASAGPLRAGRKVTVEIDSAEATVATLIGTECPGAVFLNEGDYGFFDSVFDPTSRSFLLQRFGEVGDVFVRQLVLSDFYRAVRTSTITPMELRKLLSNDALWNESDDTILENLFSKLAGRASLVNPVEAALPIEGAALRREIELRLWTKLASGKLSGDALKLWWDAWVRSVMTDEGFQRLNAVIDGREKVPGGLELDPDRRWNIISVLSLHGRPEARERIAKARAGDPSKFGVDRALVADAVAPDLDAKRVFVKESLEPKPKYSTSQFRDVFRSLLPFQQRALIARYRNELFTDFERVLREKNGDAVDTFSSILPADCSAETVAVMRTFFDRTSSILTPKARKRTLETIQDGEECVRFTALATVPGGGSVPAPKPSK